MGSVGPHHQDQTNMLGGHTVFFLIDLQTSTRREIVDPILCELRAGHGIYAHAYGWTDLPRDWETAFFRASKNSPLPLCLCLWEGTEGIFTRFPLEQGSCHLVLSSFSCSRSRRLHSRQHRARTCTHVWTHTRTHTHTHATHTHTKVIFSHEHRREHFSCLPKIRHLH